MNSSLVRLLSHHARGLAKRLPASSPSMAPCNCASFFLLFLCLVAPAFGQPLGTSGTVRGSVLDPSGAAVVGATVELHHPVSGYQRTTSTDEAGRFEFTNVPFNPYHLSVTTGGFQVAQQDVDVRTSGPIGLNLSLQIASSATSVTVQAEPGNLIEQTPTPHTDVDRSLFNTLPIENQSTGLSAVITNATPGVAADANGFFHPFGDHAQASISKVALYNFLSTFSGTHIITPRLLQAQLEVVF